MRPGAGKEKGGEYERLTGRKISLWLSHGQRDDLLCRTVGSGAQYTFASKRDKLAGIAGDLRAQDPLAYDFCQRYVLECKHWKRLEIFQFLQGQGDLYKACRKVEKEARDCSKFWMLIAKQNHQPSLLLVDGADSVVRGVTRNAELTMRHHLFAHSIYLFELDDFLKKIPPERVLLTKE